MEHLVMIRSYVQDLIAKYLKDTWGLDRKVVVDFSSKRDHGDLATPIALALAKDLKKSPQDIATEIVNYLKTTDLAEKIEIVKPGFINIFLSQKYFNSILDMSLQKESFLANDSQKDRDINLEYVSANPTGPLHIGHARWAALGDSLARLIKKNGAKVFREFYVNDEGNQIHLLEESVKAILEDRPIPEDGYHGAYLKDIAKLEGNPKENIMRMQIRNLKKLGVVFDLWFFESFLHHNELIRNNLDHYKEFGWTKELADKITDVGECLQELDDAGFIYKKDDATWFKTTEFGDDKDRVVTRSNGERTYYSSDVAYQRNKVARGYNEIVLMLGADHHGYVKRLDATVQAFEKIDHTKSKLVVLIGQLVNLLRDGEPVRMSKRTGEMITMIEVLDEIGRDALRYHLLCHKTDVGFNFDLGLVAAHSEDNPVYYVQYAHARICSIFKKAKEQGYDIKSIEKGKQDTKDYKWSDKEKDLLMQFYAIQETVREASLKFEVHPITNFLESFAAYFHRYYNAEKALTDDKEKSIQKLILLAGVKKVLSECLDILGVSAPEQMDK